MVEFFPKTGKNTTVYLIDGSGCEKCNFTGNFGAWIAGRWHHYPQIKCEHCGPRTLSGDTHAEHR